MCRAAETVQVADSVRVKESNHKARYLSEGGERHESVLAIGNAVSIRGMEFDNIVRQVPSRTKRPESDPNTPV